MPSAPRRNPSAPEAISAELEASLLRHLLLTWRDLNRTFFGGGLVPPVLALVDHNQLYGRWHRTRRSIELERRFVLEAPWTQIIEVLKHEMAHQYAHEVLGAIDETAHGPAFRRVCQQRNIDPSASGTPQSSDVPSRDDGHATPSKLKKRIGDLLALAQSPNQHESEAAAALAQKLMLKHNLQLLEGSERQRYGFRQIGRPKGRVQESEHLLASILADHFFVEAIWVPAYRPQDGKRGHVLEISGTPDNLDIAVYVHGFMQQTGERLWKEHKTRHGIRANRDRRRFIAGVMEGFYERLKREQTKHKERGMVWVGDADLRNYHRGRHPHVRSVRLSGHQGGQARESGRRAGQNIVLHKGIRTGSGSKHAKALLPPKR